MRPINCFASRLQQLAHGQKLELDHEALINPEQSKPQIHNTNAEEAIEVDKKGQARSIIEEAVAEEVNLEALKAGEHSDAVCRDALRQPNHRTEKRRQLQSERRRLCAPPQ